MIIFSVYSIATAQEYKFRTKTVTNLSNPLENRINKDKRNKDRIGIYEFKFSDTMLQFYNNGKKFNFVVDSVSNTRYWLQNKTWVIKIVQNGEALIWTFADDEDIIFTGKLE
jgi:hypothetical protein